MIDNEKAPRIKRAAALAKKKERQRTGMFLVEGPQAVLELLTHRADLAEVIFATTADAAWQFDLDALTEAHGVPVERVTAPVLQALAETVNPQGVVAVAHSFTESLTEVVDGAQLVAILHEVRDPGNAGAVLRAADACGADAVIFAGHSIDPFHPKVVRSTTGSLFHLPVAVAATLDDAVAAVRAAGLTALAADVRGTSVLHESAATDLAGRVAWVFGNEAHGLSAHARSLVDRTLKLPIYGAAESLNLATAASVLLYHTAFAQRGTTD